MKQLTKIRQLLILLVALLAFSSCQDDADEISTAESPQLPEASSANPTASGTVVYSKWGTNLNNSYSNGNTKNDWLSFNTFDSNLNTALNHLESSIWGFKIYRVGFSRGMASNATELDQWADGIRGIANHGNKVIICLWGSHQYNDINGDKNLWQAVVNKINSEGLMSAVKGWELNNEPTSGGGNRLGDYYTQVWQGVSNWHGKKIILDGPSYAKKITSTLVSRTSSISNRVFALHCYPRFVGGGNPDPSLSVDQWKDRYIDVWNKNFGPANNNFIVTELGISNDYVSSPSDARERRTRGFIEAARTYFRGSTTVFWYTSYNASPVGLIKKQDNSVRANNKTALERVF